MKIMTPKMHDAARSAGYEVQINCHAPEGYNGAYSAGFSKIGSTKLSVDMEYGDWRTKQEARVAINKIIRSLAKEPTPAMA